MKDIFFYIIVWLPVFLETFIIVRMCILTRCKKKIDKVTLVVWLVAMILAIHNTIEMRVLWEDLGL